MYANWIAQSLLHREGDDIAVSIAWKDAKIHLYIASRIGPDPEYAQMFCALLDTIFLKQSRRLSQGKEAYHSDDLKSFQVFLVDHAWSRIERKAFKIFAFDSHLEEQFKTLISLWIEDRRIRGLGSDSTSAIALLSQKLGCDREAAMFQCVHGIASLISDSDASSGDFTTNIRKAEELVRHVHRDAGQYLEESQGSFLR